MKKTLFITIFLVTRLLGFSQDIIYIKDGTEVKAKIIEITTEFVKYKRFEQQEGPLRNLQISEVFMVIYENGTREVFKDGKKDNIQNQIPIEVMTKNENAVANLPLDGMDLCFKGQQDADRYYTGYREAATWTAAATILGGIIIGIIPAIACSNSEPQMGSLTIPNSDLFKNSSYYQCYKQEAKRIKSKKVWTNFALGAAIDVAVAVLIVSLSQSE